MPIHFFSEDIEFTLENEDKISKILDISIQDHHKNVGDLNVIFTSDPYLLQMNIDYLQHNYYTDIITFNYCEEETVSGDLFISVDTVKFNAEKFDAKFEHELNRVVIHGVLHLIGFDDKTEEEKQVMREKENIYLEKLRTV